MKNVKINELEPMRPLLSPHLSLNAQLIEIIKFLFSILFCFSSHIHLPKHFS